MNDTDNSLGNYKIHCADSLEFMKSLPDTSVDCVITDPPYAGFGFKPNAYMVRFRPYLVEILRVVKREMENKRVAISQPEQANQRFSRVIPGSYQLVKISNAFSDTQRDEAAVFYVRNPVDKTHRETRRWSNLPESTHPNHRDENKLAGLIEMMSNPGDTILDPFCGSGSTGLAAVLLGRNFIGVELREDRVEDARQRFEQIGAKESEAL